jgi:acyl-homoserine lactone acylase PvdQ
MAMDQPWPGRGGLEQTEWLWRSGDRATQLETLLAERLQSGALSLRDVDDLLGDDRAPRATRVVTAIVGLARRGGPLPAEAEEVATLLERWDGRLAADSAGAAAYHLSIEHLLERLLRAPFGAGLFERYVAAPHVQPQTAIERLVLRAASLRQPGGWTDEARVVEATRASLREAWVSLNHRLGPSRDRWSWGELHRVRFMAPQPRDVPPPAPLARLAVGGSGQTLSFTHHAPGRSFEVERAALYRAAFDLGAGDRFLSGLAPGQVEHAGHPHRLDGLTRWVSARLVLFPVSRLVVEEENPQRLLLEPAL